jgi:hypothetical protein
MPFESIGELMAGDTQPPGDLTRGEKHFVGHETLLRPYLCAGKEILLRNVRE